MFKKFILFIFLYSIMNSCFALTKEDYSYISSVEKKLFGTVFAKETTSKRLDRIENNVFGMKTSGSENIRILKIKRVFKPQVSSTKTKTVSTVKKITKPQVKPSTSKIENVKYASIDEIEKRVLKKTFPTDDIYRRLSRIETVVYGGTVNDSLTNRVDNLKSTIFKDNGIKQNKPANFADTPQLSDDSVNLLLSRMEQDIFKQSYENDSVESRLDRLEMNIFNSANPEDPINDRIERLSAVIAARPTEELYKDMSSLRQYQNTSSQISAAAILLLIIQGLLF